MPRLNWDFPKMVLEVASPDCYVIEMACEALIYVAKKILLDFALFHNVYLYKIGKISIIFLLCLLILIRRWILILRSNSLIDISLRLIGHVVLQHRIMVVSILFWSSVRQSLLIFFLDFVEHQTLKENSKSNVNEIDDISNP